MAALVAAKRFDLAEEKLIALTQAMKLSTDSSLLFSSIEWIKAQTGMPMGQSWQTWSAAMFLYAARCVEEGSTPFFEEMSGE